MPVICGVGVFVVIREVKQELPNVVALKKLLFLAETDAIGIKALEYKVR